MGGPPEARHALLTKVSGHVHSASPPPTEPAAEHHGSGAASVPRPRSLPVQLRSDSLQEADPHSRYGRLARCSASFQLGAEPSANGARLSVLRSVFSGEAHLGGPDAQSQQPGHRQPAPGLPAESHRAL